jgi:hypothetical protein
LKRAIKGKKMSTDKTSVAAGSDPQSNSKVSGQSTLPIYIGLLVFVVALVASTVMFGLPGLYLPAVALVPVVFGLLLWISFG